MTRFLDSLAGTLAGLLLGVVLVGAIAPSAWVVIPAPRPAQLAVPSAPAAGVSPASGRPGTSDDHPGAPTVRAVPPVRITPSTSAVTASGPESTGRPGAAGSLRGYASTYGPGWDGWLALPQGPGVHVRICGAGGCVVRTSTDAGPSLAMQRRGRIADLDVRTFEAVCGVPWTVGLCLVVVQPIPAPPVTSTRETP